MIIGIMSDSHGNTAALERSAAVMGKVDVWLHAGDYCGDGARLECCGGVRTIAVAGNCDGLDAPSPEDVFLELGGMNVWLTHGHRYGVKRGTETLIAAARRHAVDIVIYGHTHIAEITVLEGLLVLNPGSVARAQLGLPSMIRLTVEDGHAIPQLVEIH